MCFFDIFHLSEYNIPKQRRYIYERRSKGKTTVFNRATAG